MHTSVSPRCALAPIPGGSWEVDNRHVPRLAIRCHPRAPVATEELEQWLGDELARMRSGAPHAVVRVLRLTQPVPSGEVGVGWLIELDTANGELSLDDDGLAEVLRDVRLLGLEPTVFRTSESDETLPVPSGQLDHWPPAAIGSSQRFPQRGGWDAGPSETVSPARALDDLLATLGG
jgi:hypothetical protein